MPGEVYEITPNAPVSYPYTVVFTDRGRSTFREPALVNPASRKAWDLVSTQGKNDLLDGARKEATRIRHQDRLSSHHEIEVSYNFLLLNNLIETERAVIRYESEDGSDTDCTSGLLKSVCSVQ
jgi:hypothetical protein